MKRKNRTQAYVDKSGRIVLPDEIATRLGFTPGSRVPIAELQNGVNLHRPAAQLAKIYIETTNRCNLSCRTCIRNTWNEQQGDMDRETFLQIRNGLMRLLPRPSVVFGGLGEPLAHPDIIDMVRQVRERTEHVELITNGMLLTEAVARKLIAAGLDVLWVSIDGAYPESFADVRLGAALPQVLENMARLKNLRTSAAPHIGIVFVAMRRNIAELPEVIRIGRQIEADRFLITGVIPYTAELMEEVLYTDSLSMPAPAEPSPFAPRIDLARIDLNDATLHPLYRTRRALRLSETADVPLTRTRCPFIESGSMAIAWDGSVSPCLPLMHSHEIFVHRRRAVRRCRLGNVAERSVKDIWDDAQYAALRERVLSLAFSPCVYCGGCDLSEKNEEDCFGNPFPVCGGCLWAQGVVRCP